MAENKPRRKTAEKPAEKPGEGGGWLKLPRMWSDAGGKTDADAPAGDQIQPGSGSTAAKPLVRPDAASAKPVSAKPAAAKPASAKPPVPATPTAAAPTIATSTVATPTVAVHAVQTATGREAPAGASADRPAPARSEVAAQIDLEELKLEMEQMHQIVLSINERESSMEQVFNTLHAELMDYKKDFIYEHLKPVVRPLLFLYDSLEQFDREIELYERPSNDERRQSGLAPRLVRENIGYFREQLVEALRICEVTLMETPSGAFNPKQHKAIDVTPVEPPQDNQIMRVVRAGWYLNNQILRPAEVVVGKAVPRPREDSASAQQEGSDPAETASAAVKVQ